MSSLKVRYESTFVSLLQSGMFVELRYRGETRHLEVTRVRRPLVPFGDYTIEGVDLDPAREDKLWRMYYKGDHKLRVQASTVKEVAA
jgi:hypothetical protein